MLIRDLDRIGRNQGVMGRERHRTPLLLDGKLFEGYTGRLKECEQCRELHEQLGDKHPKSGVVGSVIADFGGNHHKHKCDQCGWESATMEGLYVNPNLESEDANLDPHGTKIYKSQSEINKKYGITR